MNEVKKRMLVLLRVIRLLYVMRDVIDEYLSGKLDRPGAVRTFCDSITGDDIDIIHSSFPCILTNCYHSIMHLTESGYETSDDEMAFFRDCIVKAKKYNPDELMKFACGLR